MSFRGLRRWAAGLLISACAAGSAGSAWGQGELSRKVKSKIAPAYPDLARRMAITGVVKVEITVAANGTVKSAKLVGGHPVLANAVLDAVKKWRYETSNEETTGIVEFHFDSAQ
ncbi:MAG: energy transducer TonB [Acidobacteriia bacterium]|nr:energy transducer TonB [Terriglobia bacterium]